MTQHELPPGPAFIQARCWIWSYGRLVPCADDVPLGYIFRPATDCTPAGWVRPWEVQTQKSRRS